MSLVIVQSSCESMKMVVNAVLNLHGNGVNAAYQCHETPKTINISVLFCRQQI